MIWLRRAELARSRSVPHCCKNVQPETTFGGPETLIARGVANAADLTEGFIESIDKALIGKTNEKAIKGALGSVGSRFPAAEFEHLVEAELLMGLMVGALDAAFEVDEGVAVDATTFRALSRPHVEFELRPGALLMGANFVEADRRFASRPLEQAIRSFLKKQVVTKDVFDEMQAAAKRRAFTVAGMANTAMIDTVKSELANTLDEGKDLKDFRSFAKTRLEGAGWTPASASHVETIFRTNVMEAYNGGRHQQMSQPAVVAMRPYWQVVNPNDGPPRQRKNHQAAYLATFRADDPVFPGAIPPWDFNCRDHLRSLSQRQVDKQGISIKDGSFLTNLELPAPGFGGGEGPGGTLAGPPVKTIPTEPPEEGPAEPPAAPKAPPEEPPAAPRKPRRPRQAPAVAPAPPEPPPAPPEPPAAPPEPAPAPPAPKAPAPKAAPAAAPKPKAEPVPKVPKPKKPERPAPKLPRTPLPKLQAAVGRLEVVGKDAKTMLPKVAKALDQAGFSQLINPANGGIDNFTITDKFAPIVSNTEMPEGALGAYWNPLRAKPGSYFYGVSTNRPAIQAEMSRARRERSAEPRQGEARLWSVSDLAESEAEFIQMTAVHEFGHAVHKHIGGPSHIEGDKLAAEIDGIIRAAKTAEGDRIIGDDDATPITRYAATNHNEFFAEAFSFHHHRPEQLKKASPIAYKMVQDVLRLRGML